MLPLHPSLHGGEVYAKRAADPADEWEILVVVQPSPAHP